MAYQSWSVIFGEQPSAAKWNILGTNDAHFYSFLGDNLDWQSWTPTRANLTIGNGTETAVYSERGENIEFVYIFSLGSTSAVGTNPTITLPITPHSRYLVADYQIARGQALDATTASVASSLDFSSGTAFVMRAALSTGTYATYTSFTASVPHTWGTGDSIMFSGSYEAA